MLKGLFTSIFGATDEGIFDILYSRHGASPPVKSTEIRLGDYGQADDEKDDEEDKPASKGKAVPSNAGPPPVPMSEASPNSSKGFFSQDIGGFPLWLVGVGFLGFAWSFRRKRKKKQASRRR